MSFWENLKDTASSGISAYVDGAVEEQFSPATNTTAASPLSGKPTPGDSGMDSKKWLMIGGGVLAAVVVLVVVLRK